MSINDIRNIKIGDLLEVTKEGRIDRCNVGDIVEVVVIDSECDSYPLKVRSIVESEEESWLKPNQVKLVNPANNFKISEIKSGYLLEIESTGAETGMYMVCPYTEGFMLITESGWDNISLDEFNDNLIAITFLGDVLKVNKIYGHTKLGELSLTFNTRHRDLLWSRSGDKVFRKTKEELEQELGYSFELIKERPKIGDKVKVVSKKFTPTISSKMRVGNIGVITEIRCDGDDVRINGELGNWVSIRDIELIEAKNV